MSDFQTKIVHRDDGTELQEITMTHRIHAPLKDAWEIYTRPEHIAHWWGLKELETVSCESDVRVGGTWRFVIRGDDGEEYPFSGVFREIEPYTRLVYTDGYGEADTGRPEAVVTVLFTQQPDGTTLLTKSSVDTADAHRTKAAWLQRASDKHDKL